MDAVTDPAVEQVVVCSSAQVGKTEVLLNLVGFHMHQDPAPMLLLQPTLEMGQAFSKDRLSPMLRDTAALRGLVKDPRARDSGNTLLQKTFAGGHLTIAGANSPASLASRPIRVVLLDEVDRFPASAGSEGDPVSLAQKRAANFHNRKLIAVSTPTIAGASRIQGLYERSDQRRFYVPCPHCGHAQVLRWQQVRWYDRDPATAHYVCEGCEGTWDDPQRWAAIRNGYWEAQATFRGTAGFHMSELMSPWRRLSETVADFLAKKDFQEQLKTWINQALGETWEPPAEREIDEADLLARREPYPAEVPDGVALLTAGVDTQPDRLEVEIVGWGYDEESWSIDHQVLLGDPDEREVWEKLDGLRLKRWACADGRSLTIDAMCVDTGGHNTQAAYRYGVERVHHNVFPIKGRGKSAGSNSANRGLVFQGRPSRKRSKSQTNPFLVDVDTAKDTVFPRLSKVPPGPTTCHFPAHYEPTYFDQLTAEKPVAEWVKGEKVWRWKRKAGRANEALDCRVYAYAALCALQQAGLRLNQQAAKVGATAPDQRKTVGPDENAKHVRPHAQGETEQPAPERPTGKAHVRQRSSRSRRRKRMVMG